MSSNEDQAARSSKVRMACKRCRVKRIKCDGKLPACGNCQKAQEACLDVDARNNALSIPRDFAVTARARVGWLEDQIRQMSPTFNLAEGPKVDFGFMDGQPAFHALGAQSPGATMNSSNVGKRSYPSTADVVSEGPTSEEARSVAFDLGMISLNSDSRQTHYLGSSSGRLFTSLIGVEDSPNNSPSPSKDRGFSTSVQNTRSKRGPLAHSKQMKDLYRNLLVVIRTSLPSKDDARILLDVYIQNVHVDHPFLHLNSLINALDALYQCSASDPSTPIGHNGWLEHIEPFAYNGEYETFRGANCTPITTIMATFHVFMVFTLAATIRMRGRIYDYAPNQFHKVAMSFAPGCLSQTSTASLQAVLFLAVHSLLTPAEVNIWTLTHVAMAHCIDLGLHRTTQNNQQSISRSATITKTMLFFCVYHLDRSVSTIQGRPLGIRDETFDVELPNLQDIRADLTAIKDSELVPDTSIVVPVAFALHRFKLDSLVSEMKQILYLLPSQVNALVIPTDLEASQRSIRRRLDDWRDELAALGTSLEEELEFEQPLSLTYRMKLQCQYYMALILLYQPSQAIPHPNDNAVATCYKSAASRLATYHELYNADSLYLSWRSIQGIFSSGATIIYCLWTSSILRSSIPSVEAVKTLRICENLLSVGGEWWPSVKRGKESFGKAMDAIMAKLSNDQRVNAYSAFSNSRPPVRRAADAPTQARQAAMSANSMPFINGHENNMPVFETSNLDHNRMEYTGTRWTVLGSYESQDFAPQFDPRALPGPDAESAIFAAPNASGQDSFDPTIDDFIAEFMGGDTSWDLF